MGERYKQYPFGWGHLRIPVSRPADALVGIGMYAPCRPAAVWAHRLAWRAVRALGPRVLPSRVSQWSPPLEPKPWTELCERWRAELGPFDSMAVYQRPQSHRAGVLLLLLRGGEPIALTKLRRRGSPELSTEALALKAFETQLPSSFEVPRVMAQGEVSSWDYLALSPLPVGPHRPPRHPPIGLIVRQVEAALAELPRPAGTPPEWRPMHGDFTPWNLRQLDDGRLFLLDWEEAGWGPPGADETLYRASAAAIRGDSVVASDALEAVSFWQSRVKRRPVDQRHDKRLSVSLLRNLETMKATCPSRSPRRRSSERPRVLVFAYACEPERGSEPGAGWGLTQSVVEFADCVVLVGPEHGATLRRWQARHESDSVRFVEVPEPRGARYAKWHRLPWFVLYRIWLRKAYALGLDLHRQRPFDAVFHATWATFWLSHPARHLDVPCVWGPVGGAVTTPLRLWPALGWRGLLDELLDFVSIRLACLWPATRRTWKEVAARLVQNDETLDRMPQALRSRTRILNNFMFIETPHVEPRPRKPHILYLGALESRKGPRLALRALAHTPTDIHLLMAGEGPERRSLQSLARRLGVADRVRFIGHVPREEVFDLFAEAAAVLFPYLREEGGVALAEAMLAGAPVIVLANGGLRVGAASSTDPKRVALVYPGGLDATARRLAEAMTRFSRQPPSATGPMLDRLAARSELREVFESSIGVRLT